VGAAFGAALEQPTMLEEHVHELPEHVVQGLDELLGDVVFACPRLELPVGADARKGDRQAAADAGSLHYRGSVVGVRAGAESDDDVIGPHQQLDLRGQ
jgi:hypothetical protein